MKYKDPKTYPWLVVRYVGATEIIRLNRFRKEVCAVMASRLIYRERPDWSIRVIYDPFPIWK